MIGPAKRWALLLVVALVGGCSALALPPGPAGGHPGNPGPAAPTLRPPGPVLQFSYEALDGKSISTASLTNRVSVIGLLATYELPSQAAASVLARLATTHKPRINVAALILEPEENRPLVEAFAKLLALPFPVALADAATIAGEGPFTGLHHVPSVVILDKEGREVWRHLGFVDQATLEAAVKAAEQAR